jgi:CRP-like cAMP-binding protein
MFREWVDILCRCTLFQGIDSDSLNTMLSCLKPVLKQYKQRELIAVAGQAFGGIGIVADGSIALARDTYSGNRIIIEIIGEGAIFGESAAFSEDRTWPVTVIAQEDSTLLFLPASKLATSCSNICGSHNRLILNTLAILSDRVRSLNHKIEQLSAKSNRAKVSRYLLEIYNRGQQANIVLPMKRHQLADYLGMPRPSLSRELCLMRERGLIAFNGSSVKLKNIAALEKTLE